jgi:hypothetical protein
MYVAYMVRTHLRRSGVVSVDFLVLAPAKT